MVAVAVVAQAVWGMARNLCTDGLRVTIMAIATCVSFYLCRPRGTGWRDCYRRHRRPVIVQSQRKLLSMTPPITVSHRAGVLWPRCSFVLLIGLPVLAELMPSQTMAMVDSFYRVGSLVFGGGHVVLPLLQAEVVPSGWVNNESFRGYGAALAVPGPLFTFAAFLGASMNTAPSGWIGGIVCLLAIFAPSFLLVVGSMPFWERLRRNTGIQLRWPGSMPL